MLKQAQTGAMLLTLLVASVARPQGGTSTVRGIVRDQVQAVIPGAKVTLTNTGTTVARDSLTNESGLYVFPAVTPGLTGFQWSFPACRNSRAICRCRRRRTHRWISLCKSPPA